MNYLVESIFVGFYILLLYGILGFIFTRFKLGNMESLLFFILGFVKHLLGYLLGIHTYYCNYGYKCLGEGTRVATSKNLIVESFIEGIYFICFGIILSRIVIDNNVKSYNKTIIMGGSIFVFGVGTHILAELLGIHTYFCKNNCINV